MKTKPRFAAVRLRPFRAAWLIALAGMMGSALVGCRPASRYPDQPVTLVVPWAAGGGTDRVSRQVAAHLEVDLGVPVNVINATGGKGVTGHSRLFDARPDGYTIGTITFELNMMHWSGLTRLTYRDCQPLMSINEDYAAVFVRRDSPFETLGDLEAAIRERPGQIKGSGTANGGAWHVALAGWLLERRLKADDVRWISSTGAGPSLQELLSGGLDLVCCSLPECESLLRAGELRALGVMAPRRVPGYDEVPTFAEQGSSWSLGGWRGMAMPLGTPPDRVERMTAALGRVVRGETKIVTSEGETTFPDFMKAARFDHTWRSTDEFLRLLADVDAKCGALAADPAMKSVNSDRYSPMTFPNLLFALIGVALVGVGYERRRRLQETPSIAPSAPASDDDAPAKKVAPTTRGRWSFVLVLAFVALYMLLAETVGFVLTIGMLLAAMMRWFGVRTWVALVVAATASSLVYQVFANVLRVPMPRGWLGW